jgi:hypothetical protein
VGAEALRGCNTKECGYVAIGFLAVAAATGTVGALIGGVEGAVRAMPAGEARRIDDATRYLRELNLQETLWNRTLDAARDRTEYLVYPIPAGGPTASDCAVDYGNAARRGLDSIVETAVLSVGFIGEKWGSNPPLSVFLRVRVRRYRVAELRMEMVAEKEFLYRSRERLFPEWMADQAARVEEEFQRGYAVLAAEIADWM